MAASNPSRDAQAPGQRYLCKCSSIVGDHWVSLKTLQQVFWVLACRWHLVGGVEELVGVVVVNEKGCGTIVWFWPREKVLQLSDISPVYVSCGSVLCRVTIAADLCYFFDSQGIRGDTDLGSTVNKDCFGRGLLWSCRNETQGAWYKMLCYEGYKVRS